MNTVYLFPEFIYLLIANLQYFNILPFIMPSVGNTSD